MITNELNLKSDEELMVIYQNGQSAAFDLLYKRYSMKVYGYLKNSLKDANLTDDVFQGTFLKLHTSRTKYDPTFPFVPWLFTVCKSVMIDHLRKIKTIKEVSNQEYLENFEQVIAEEIELPNLNVLPLSQKLAVDYRYRDDLSFDEIAKKLETSPINARKLISRAIQKLKITLKEGSEK